MLKRRPVTIRPMGRPKQFDREEVLSRAMELFRRKGYSATSIDDIVHELKINRASLYDTFGGKRELFDEALARYSQNSRQFVAHFFAGDGVSMREKFLSFFSGAIESMKSGKTTAGCLVANSTAELLPGDKKAAAFLGTHRDRIEEIFATAIKEAMKVGEIKGKKDVGALARFLYTFHNGLSLQAKLPSDKESLMASARQALQVVFD
jgi:TetR/AcrR family transcriptional regulator, transcriptional repressor for nem operon